MFHRALLTLLLVSIEPLFGLALPSPQGCGGCTGTGGTSSASGGSCGGLITVSVSMEAGNCKWVSDDLGVQVCRETKGCKPTVTRHWEGLPPNVKVDYCVTLGGDELCLKPPPSSGPGGSGTDIRASAPMP